MAEQRFGHAVAGGTEGRVEHIVEAAQQIIGVAHRILGYLLQPVGAVAEHISERAGEHAHLTVESGHASEGLRVILARTLLFDQAQAVRSEWRRRGQECVSTCRAKWSS